MPDLRVVERDHSLAGWWDGLLPRHRALLQQAAAFGVLVLCMVAWVVLISVL